MHPLFLLSGLQAITLIYALPTSLEAPASKPNDILSLGTQSLPSKVPATAGSVVQVLETAGRPSVQPFPTSVKISVVSTLSLAGNQKIAVVSTSAAPTISNIFDAPIATTVPGSGISSRTDHPVPKTGVANQAGKIATNKFYANFFLGTQTDTVFIHPYSLQWTQGTTNAKSYGLSVSHVDAKQRFYGPNATANPVEYYSSPLGIQSIIFSAAQLGATTTLTTDTLTAFSANVNLLPKAGAAPAITVPLVQGAGFVTAIYKSVTPYIDSGVSFKIVTPLKSPAAGITKYRLLLNDGNTWLLYARSNNGSGLALTATSSTRLKAPGYFAGTIQIAKNPGAVATQETTYDSCAGAYAAGMVISGSTSGSIGSYSFGWTRAGNAAGLLMFALPHHISSLVTSTIKTTSIKLQTTTKGVATGIIANSWTLSEPSLPVNIGFKPINPVSGTTATISAASKNIINTAGTADLSQDMNAQSNLNSMYYSGKALSKFATAIYAIHDVAGNTTLASAGLSKLEAAFARFTTNKQQYPLVYESQWGGVVSSASYVTGDSNADFGNSYYNDHHFHYGYFIHAAAIIGYLDKNWLTPANKAWVNTLIRDASNPSTKDPYFPQLRSFDFYHGHSWAKGLFTSGDSKDEESSSEDALFSYALKMWGQVTGDAAMEARGSLMLAIQKRAFQNYFLLESTNVNHPANFIKNKVSGIMFENKVDHTTYFGANLEYIQGIHMLPINPSSAYTRNQNFVAEEWNAYFSNGRADVAGGWRGILYSNLALIDAKSAWNFFNARNFDAEYLDGGASLTGYLALAACLGGAP